MRSNHSVRLFFLLLLLAGRAEAQTKKLDELLSSGNAHDVLDSLMIGFDDYLDSILRKQDHFHASMGVGSGLYSMETRSGSNYVNQSRIVLSPAVGFMHRSGFGVNAAAFIMADGPKITPYMGALIPSYDLLRRSYSAGVSYSHYFVKDSLNFYTSPINHELYAYFTWKQWPVRPSIALSYGWGSEASYNRRKLQVQKNRRKSRTVTVIEKNIEQVSDLSMIFSLRKDFNFFELISKRDMLSITPVMLVRGGTQQYGFNSTYSYEVPGSVKVNNLPTNNSLSARSRFQPESAAIILRASYLHGNWIVQPQFLLDYYLTGAEAPVTTAWSLTAGWSF